MGDLIIFVFQLFERILILHPFTYSPVIIINVEYETRKFALKRVSVRVIAAIDSNLILNGRILSVFNDRPSSLSLTL